MKTLSIVIGSKQLRKILLMISSHLALFEFVLVKANLISDIFDEVIRFFLTLKICLHKFCQNNNKRVRGEWKGTLKLAGDEGYGRFLFEKMGKDKCKCMGERGTISK